MVFTISCYKHLAKATKDNGKIRFQISEKAQSSALHDPRVRRNIGQVPKTSEINPGSYYRWISPQTKLGFSCATLTHIVQLFPT